MMARRQALIVAGALLLVAAGLILWLVPSGESGADQEELALGRELYAAQCAACHGSHLQGQPDWETPLPDGKMPAPPLNATGHASHHPDSELFRIVKEGMASVSPGRPTEMPAFEGILSDQEIAAILAYARSTW